MVGSADGVDDSTGGVVASTEEVGAVVGSVVGSAADEAEDELGSTVGGVLVAAAEEASIVMVVSRVIKKD